MLVGQANTAYLALLQVSTLFAVISDLQQLLFTGLDEIVAVSAVPGCNIA